MEHCRWSIVIDISLASDITVVVVHETQVAFKNCASFTKYITKFDVTEIDDAEDLTWLCWCIIRYCTVQIILTQQVVYSYILRMNN